MAAARPLRKRQRLPIAQAPAGRLVDPVRQRRPEVWRQLPAWLNPEQQCRPALAVVSTAVLALWVRQQRWQRQYQRLVRKHFQYTRSKRAEEVLKKWEDYGPKFVKVFPKDLKVALDMRLEAHVGDG